MPLSVSVHDGHVCVSAAGFARLADSSTSRSRPPFLASSGARHAKRRQGPSKWLSLKSFQVAFAALLEHGHPRHHSRACCAFVPPITPTCVPRRPHAAYRRARAATSRGGRALQERRHVEISDRSRRWVGERAHPGERRQSEQRRAGVRARHFPCLPPSRRA